MRTNGSRRQFPAIVIERTESGTYSAFSPSLLGCIAAAKTKDECVQLMQEAIQLHLEDVLIRGEPIPQPSTDAAAE